MADRSALNGSHAPSNDRKPQPIRELIPTEHATMSRNLLPPTAPRPPSCRRWDRCSPTEAGQDMRREKVRGLRSPWWKPHSHRDAGVPLLPRRNSSASLMTQGSRGEKRPWKGVQVAGDTDWETFSEDLIGGIVPRGRRGDWLRRGESSPGNHKHESAVTKKQQTS